MTSWCQSQLPLLSPQGADEGVSTVEGVCVWRGGKVGGCAGADVGNCVGCGGCGKCAGYGVGMESVGCMWVWGGRCVCV